jgi:hypothetical protein
MKCPTFGKMNLHTFYTGELGNNTGLSNQHVTFLFLYRTQVLFKNNVKAPYCKYRVVQKNGLEHEYETQTNSRKPNKSLSQA